MTAALLALLLAAPAAALPDLSARAPAVPQASPGHATGTDCAACHTSESWSDVAFAHERTGFPLEGAHRRATCKSCHPGSFQQKLPTACAACHRDPHAGLASLRCQGCHSTEAWRPAFGVEAHRRTNFPLTGRHALIPCEECHGDRRDRAFARATVDCAQCHQKDLSRAARTGLDHQAAGFTGRCLDCHGPWRFQGASFPGHDRCFQLSGGPHAGVRCLDCHTTLAGAFQGGASGACSTGTAQCTRCHSCAVTSARHAQVAGFQCKDRKCYECHQFSGASQALRRSAR
ncbi:cytochrome C [Anaeromyxobacter paludicola]|uniref:Cytochrome c7-like domain-containing protein n=1 Tax=Anaeromyxobacter paludicola TaxID=2918171 RepID=A0ABM7XDJ4_9BACT|nr:cytochrome C [Anaeromyxobacter paludicola]BDG09951.1 hypothetical protein AMPC_30640 [Anaeromyxobacter paludicola]